MSDIFRGIGCVVVMWFAVRAACAVAVLVFMVWAFHNPDAAANVVVYIVDKALTLAAALLRAFVEHSEYVDGAKGLS